MNNLDWMYYDEKPTDKAHECCCNCDTLYLVNADLFTVACSQLFFFSLYADSAACSHEVFLPSNLSLLLESCHSLGQMQRGGLICEERNKTIDASQRRMYLTAGPLKTQSLQSPLCAARPAGFGPSNWVIPMISDCFAVAANPAPKDIAVARFPVVDHPFRQSLTEK